MDRTRRTDLEALEVDYTATLIANQLIPVISMGGLQNVTGDLYFVPVDAVSAVITDRANGASLSSNSLAETSIAYTCVKKETRHGFEEAYYKRRDAGAMDARGGKKIKKDLQFDYEKETVASLLVNGAPIDITGVTTGNDDVIEAVALQKESMEGVVGEYVLAMSDKVFNKLKRRTEVKDRMTFQGVNLSDGKVIRGFAESVLAEILNVDKLIVGANQHWAETAGHDERMALIKVPVNVQSIEEDDLSIEPYFMVRLQTLGGEGDSELQIHSFFNTDNNNYSYDGLGYSDLVVLNAEGLVTFSGIA